jgi:hypothetical protein
MPANGPEIARAAVPASIPNVRRRSPAGAVSEYVLVAKYDRRDWRRLTDTPPHEAGQDVT